jgi:hypothetical protein
MSVNDMAASSPVTGRVPARLVLEQKKERQRSQHPGCGKVLPVGVLCKSANGDDGLMFNRASDHGSLHHGGAAADATPVIADAIWVSS